MLTATITHDPATPFALGTVNLAELHEVRTKHMPETAVRFAAFDEVQRVAQEVAHREPRLKEEAAFVVVEEYRRRLRCQQPIMAISK